MTPVNLLPKEDVMKLAKEHGFPNERIAHCSEVADLALQISTCMINEGIPVDKNVVEKGALLHDIGYLQCKGELIEIPGWKDFGIKVPADDINHPMTGAVIAKEWGFGERVADCVLKHNIGGFTLDECKLLNVHPLPEKDCRPVLPEEKVVHYADHLMLLKRIRLDPQADPQASARAVLPWLRYYFKERANRRIELDDPIVQREVELNDELKGYLRSVKGFRV
jgi:putative nucleotidyltransferase with HDIG domain